MAASKRVAKRRLRNMAMYVDRARGFVEEKLKAIHWKIKDFPQLITDTEYGISVIKLDWTLILTKEWGGSIVVRLLTGGYNGEIKCCVIYDLLEASEILRAELIDEGEHKVTFPLEVLDNRRNLNLLKKECLSLQFSYNPGCILMKVDRLARGRKSEIDENDFQRDVFAIMKHRRFTDSAIRVKREVFLVHKSLMSIRCSKFRELFESKGGEMELDTSYRAMSDVLFFVYSGQLKVAGVDSVIEILDLAATLGITKLEGLCTFYLRKNINGRNARQILELATKYEVRKLMRDAEKVLRRLRE